MNSRSFAFANPETNHGFRRAFLLVAALGVAPAAHPADVGFSAAAGFFGSVALTESKMLTIAFKNNTALSVNITAVAITGANAADFKQTHNCPKPIPAGTGCTFTLTFTPAALTKRTATLTASTDDPAQPTVNLALSGNAYGALNDTGITTCSNSDSNGRKCPVAGFPGQDAEYGRDKTKNNSANGRAGFSFTKLDAKGKPLPATATSWNCVRDNVTGLVWEVKPKPDGTRGNQGLHDADDTYSWYSTDSTNNGGSVGYPNQGNTCNGYNSANAATFCNTQAYAKRVNAAGWCGAKDWRVPNRRELKSLVDLSVTSGPTIAVPYFPDALADWYWSSSPNADGSGVGWFVNFNGGYSSSVDYRASSGAVRLVRGGQ